MRVALVCPYAWDAPGGVQVHVRRLAEHLRRRGHSTLVLTPSFGRLREAGVVGTGRAVRVRYQGTVAPIAPWPGSVRAVARVLRSFGPEVVHAHEPLTPSTSMWATISAPAPVVGTFHAFTERSALFDAAAPILRAVWRRIGVRIAVSEAAVAFVGRRMPGAVRIIPNGVDVELFARARPASGLPEGRRVLWVGRLDPQKGFPVAVRAFARLADLDDVRLLVIGDGRERAAVRLAPPGVRGRITLIGTVPHDLLPSYHAASDVLISPALGQESFGMVLVEAMAAALPVVASDIPGYREVVEHGREGLLVPPGDPDALAAAIRRVLSDPDAAGQMGEAGRRRADRYRWETVARELERAYEEAAAGHP